MKTPTLKAPPVAAKLAARVTSSTAAKSAKSALARAPSAVAKAFVAAPARAKRKTVAADEFDPVTGYTEKNRRLGYSTPPPVQPPYNPVAVAAEAMLNPARTIQNIAAAAAYFSGGFGFPLPFAAPFRLVP